MREIQSKQRGSRMCHYLMTYDSKNLRSDETFVQYKLYKIGGGMDAKAGLTLDFRARPQVYTFT